MDATGRTLIHHLALGGTKEWYDTPISDIHSVLSAYRGQHEMIVILDSCHSSDSLERAKRFTASDEGRRVALIHTSGMNVKVAEEPLRRLVSALGTMDTDELVGVLSDSSRLVWLYCQLSSEQEKPLCIRRGKARLGRWADEGEDEY